jgi:predicted enzyme related to lactoylglutathione lyase
MCGLHQENIMGAVTGFGGAFLRSKDPKKLSEWYSKHLGISGEHGSFNFPAEKQRAVIVLAFFPQTSDYFPTSQPTMLNFQVDDLDALRTRLIGEGVDVDPKVDEVSYGRFGWLTDPEGNRVELWQPL